MSEDTRTDAGEYYPGGGSARPRIIDRNADMKHSEFAEVEAVPQRFTDDMLRDKVNEVIGLLKGPVAALAIAALAVATTLGAGITVQRAPQGEIYNDEQIVTNVTFDASGLATTGELAQVSEDVATNAERIVALELEIAALPDPDYSTNNTVLVETIETVAPQPEETDPVWTAQRAGYVTTGEVAQVARDLADHASATNNPHHVTAAQIGALSASGGEVTGELIVPGATFGVGYVHFTGSRPAYFDNGVHNLAFTSEIPTKVGDLTNDAGYITGYTEADPHAAGMASNVVTQAYIREKLGVYLYVGQDGGIYVHTEE